MKHFFLFLVGACAALAPLAGHAQATTTTTTTTTAPTTTSASGAVGVARDAVDQSVRDHLVSVYGVGTAAGIQTWWVIFYDPAVASHGRAVKIESGAVTKTYDAQVPGITYNKDLTFSNAKVSDEGPALSAAQNYAAKNSLAYDNVRVLLRKTNPKEGMRWRVQLLDGPTSKGFVFVNSSDGTFALYSPPGTVPSRETSSTGGVVGDAKRIGNDVKNTFLNVGGDLQQFFTGERTVDQ
jgi:hypothetical protein